VYVIWVCARHHGHTMDMDEFRIFESGIWEQHCVAKFASVLWTVVLQSCYSTVLGWPFFFHCSWSRCLDSNIHTMKYIDTPHLLPPWSGNMSKRKTNFVFSPFSLGSMLCPVPCVGVPRNASEGRDRSSTVLLNVFLFYRTYPPRPIWLETACSMK